MTVSPSNLSITTPEFYRERTVLDCMVTAYEEHAHILDDVTVDDFTFPEYRQLMRIVDQVRRKTPTVTLASLLDECGDDGKALDLVISVAHSSLTFAAMDGTVAKLKEDTRNRRITNKINDILRSNPDDLIVALEAVVDSERIVAKDGQELEQASVSFLRNVEKSLKDSRLPTGFGLLDATLGWLPRGSLSVLGARPSVGKTTFALNVAVKVKKAGKSVMIASMEMSEEQIMERVASIMSGVPYTKINQHRLSKRDTALVKEAIDLLLSYEGEFSIYDSLFNVDEIVAKMAQRKPALLIVDFLQYMNTGSENRSQALAEIVRRFKQAARIYNTHILLLSQLNREAEKATRPTMANLWESGAIEAGGDIIMFLHRPGVTDRNIEKSITELIVAKNKYGETGIIDMNFNGEIQRFTEVAVA